MGAEGKYDQMLRQAERLIVRFPGNSEADLLLAEVYYLLDRFEQCIDLLDTVIKLDQGGCLDAWLRISGAYAELHRWPEALAAAAMAMRIRPMAPVAYDMAARAWEGAGRGAEASDVREIAAYLRTAVKQKEQCLNLCSGVDRRRLQIVLHGWRFFDSRS